MNRFLVQACSLSIIYNHEFGQTLKVFVVHILNVTFRRKRNCQIKVDLGSVIGFRGLLERLLFLLICLKGLNELEKMKCDGL